MDESIIYESKASMETKKSKEELKKKLVRDAVTKNTEKQQSLRDTSRPTTAETKTQLVPAAASYDKNDPDHSNIIDTTEWVAPFFISKIVGQCEKHDRSLPEIADNDGNEDDPFSLKSLNMTLTMEPSTAESNDVWVSLDDDEPIPVDFAKMKARSGVDELKPSPQTINELKSGLAALTKDCPISLIKDESLIFGRTASTETQKSKEKLKKKLERDAVTKNTEEQESLRDTSRTTTAETKTQLVPAAASYDKNDPDHSNNLDTTEWVAPFLISKIVGQCEKHDRSLSETSNNDGNDDDPFALKSLNMTLTMEPSTAESNDVWVSLDDDEPIPVDFEKMKARSGVDELNLSRQAINELKTQLAAPTKDCPISNGSYQITGSSDNDTDESTK